MGSFELFKCFLSHSLYQKISAFYIQSVESETALAKATAELLKVTLQMRSAGNDHLKLAKISEELAKAQAKVHAAEETWLTLVAEAE